MSTVSHFLTLLQEKGSPALYHREDDESAPCPCRTPEGMRDPIWHLQNPTEPLCNEAGFLPGVVVDVEVRAFVQPIQSTRATRLSTEMLVQMFGEVQADDHLGIFPCQWASVLLDFNDWGPSGEDYIEYNDKRYIVINANLIPDPDDGYPFHHWEVGLRLITRVPISA